MEEIVLVGYGGHARSVADCIERQNKYRIVGYTDVEQRNSRYQYLGTDTVLKDWYEQGIKNAAVGIGYMGKGTLRERLYESLRAIGYELPVIADPSAVISDHVQIGEGTFIGKGAVVNAEARIGKMAIINSMALVEHDCIVEDYAHVAVSGVLCGQVKVGKAAFIGANATILQCMEIPSKVTIPAGEVVRRNYRMEVKKNCKILTNKCRGGGNLNLTCRQLTYKYAGCVAV